MRRNRVKRDPGVWSPEPGGMYMDIGGSRSIPRLLWIWAVVDGEMWATVCDAHGIRWAQVPVAASAAFFDDLRRLA